MSEAEKEQLIKKDIESIENRVRHAFNQGYEMKIKEILSENPNRKMVDKSIMHYEELWDRLYNWLNDMRFSIAPDETVTDDNDRNGRLTQMELLDAIMEWMVDQVPKAE